MKKSLAKDLRKDIFNIVFFSVVIVLFGLAIAGGAIWGNFENTKTIVLISALGLLTIFFFIMLVYAICDIHGIYKEMVSKQETVRSSALAESANKFAKQEAQISKQKQEIEDLKAKLNAKQAKAKAAVTTPVKTPVAKKPETKSKK